METPWLSTSAFDLQRGQSIRDLYVIIGMFRTTTVLGKLAYLFWCRAERRIGRASSYRETVLDHQKNASCETAEGYWLGMKHGLRKTCLIFNQHESSELLFPPVLQTAPVCWWSGRWRQAMSSAAVEHQLTWD